MSHSLLGYQPNITRQTKNII